VQSRIYTRANVLFGVAVFDFERFCVVQYEYGMCNRCHVQHEQHNDSTALRMRLDFRLFYVSDNSDLSSRTK
jgi:hypothetical protein